MKILKSKIPPHIARCLWSYDVLSIDITKDRELIITQVLNYGDWRGITWLWKTYPESVIRGIVSHPRRGLWFAQVLNFWELMLKIKLSRLAKERAIFRIDPRIGLAIQCGRGYV